MSNVAFASAGRTDPPPPTHVLAAHRHVGAGRGERVGGPLVQTVQGRLIGGGVLRDRCERRSELNGGAVAGSHFGRLAAT